MKDIKALLDTFGEIAGNPKAQLEKTLAAGKKAVGVLPAFCPEELVYAAGMLPFGIWGADRTVSESNRYFPAFYCSILHTALELGIRGELNGLSAVLIPACCDSLKGMVSNWKYAVPDIPFIHVSYAENRKLSAGITYTKSQYRKILGRLEEIAGCPVSDADIRAAVLVYSENRNALADFSRAAAKHPASVSPTRRCAVFKAGYFMDRQAHTALVRELTEALNALPAEAWSGLRVVTTGILSDAPGLLKILEDNQIAVVADQVLYESVTNGTWTRFTPDPMEGIAQRLGMIEGSSLLYDPEKQRGRSLVELAKSTRADGVIWMMTKFCDPEEFDYVPVRQMLADAGIPLLTIETDRQMTDYGQARSAVEAFVERLS